MKRLLIYEPEETVNLVTNPRVADNATGYTASGAAISRSLDRARWGRASLKVITNGVGLNEGAYFRVDPQQKTRAYAGSVYVRGAGRVRARLRDGTNGVEFATDPVVLDDQHWTRLEIVGSVGGLISNDLRLYVETARTVQSVTFYADGFQIEQKSQVTSYADGDLELEIPPHLGGPYFRWNGTRNGATSTRSINYRPAGAPRSVELEGVGVYVTQASGLGMPPVRVNLQELGSGERSVVQGHRALARPINLVFWARRQRGDAESLRQLHDLRESLEALIKPDRSPGSQPFRFRYLDGADSMDVLAHYESGLEFDGDLRFPWFNSFGVRLLIPDPYWTSDGQDVQQLLANSSVPNADYIVAKIEGVWQALGTGANGTVHSIVVHPNGDIYAGGEFTSMGGVANTARIARWDGTQWRALASGIDDGLVSQIAIGPDGAVYVGGTFVNISAVVYNQIARYSPASDTFSTMGPGPGLNISVQAIAATKSNKIYIGGQMTGNAVLYDPDSNTFSVLGSGLDSTVHEIVIDLDGETPYLVGNFTQEVSGPTLDRVATYDYDSDTFTQLGETGANNRVRFVVIARDGRLYAGGHFTSIGWGAAEKIGIFDRQDWHALGQIGDGMVGGTTVRSIAVQPTGRIVIGGDFISATGADVASRLASWNGTNFSHMDVELGGAATVYAIAAVRDELYVGFDTSGVAALAPYVVTVTNRGKAAVAPTLECVGPALLLWLENVTTGSVIRMNLEVQPSEHVVVDLREGMFRAWSDFRGDVGYGILADSDVGNFKLVPGENVIAFKAKDTGVQTEFSLRWPIHHWSFDDVSWARDTG